MEVIEPFRFLSIVVDMRRRVNADGASSSSLEWRRQGSRKRQSKALNFGTDLSLQPSPVVRPIPAFKSCPSRCLIRLLSVSRGSLNSPDLVVIEPAYEALSLQVSRLWHRDVRLTSRSKAQYALCTRDRLVRILDLRGPRRTLR